MVLPYISSLHNQKFGTLQENFENENIYIFGCRFIDCEATGGKASAINVSSATETTKMLIEKCFFKNCNSFSSELEYCHGPIYYGEEGSAVILQTCGLKCSSGFIYTAFKNNAKLYTSNFIESSVCFSESEYHVIDVSEASVLFTRTNCSYNKNKGATYSCVSSSCVNTLSCSHFVNNTGSYIVDIERQDDSQLILCNIMKNGQIKDNGIIVYSSKDLEVKHSCIIENNADYIFYTESSSTITVSDCTLAQDDVSKTSGSVTITDTNTYIKTIELAQLMNYNCELFERRSNCLTKSYFVSRNRNIAISIMIALVMS